MNVNEVRTLSNIRIQTNKKISMQIRVYFDQQWKKLSSNFNFNIKYFNDLKRRN